MERRICGKALCVSAAARFRINSPHQCSGTEKDIAQMENVITANNQFVENKLKTPSFS